MTFVEWNFQEINRILLEMDRNRDMRVRGPMKLLDEARFAVKELQENMEKLMEQQHDQGIQDGHDDSYDEGYEDGETKGFEKGLAAGRADPKAPLFKP